MGIYGAALGVLLSLALSHSANAEHVFGVTQGGKPGGKGNQCEVFPTHGKSKLRDGKLTPFWAYEVIGADLARSATDKFPGVQKVPLEVIDGGFHLENIPDGLLSPQLLEDKKNKVSLMPRLTRRGLLGGERADEEASKEYASHGTEVLLVAAGVTSQVRLEKATSGATSDSLDEALQCLGNEGDRVVNLCVGTDHVRFSNDFREKRRNSKTPLLIAASGNANPQRNEAAWNLSQLNSIGVASLHPVGFLSAFSQEGFGRDTVSIVAPGEQILSPVDGTEILSGTSFAAPLVTGSLINVRAILGSLSTAEARELLKKTAVPTANSRMKTGSLGSGMVNSYKLVEVAKRLAAAGWKEKSETERADLIKQDALYDFTSPIKQSEPLFAPALLQEAKKLIAAPDCERRRAGVTQLRQALLLSAGTDTEEGKQTYFAAASWLASAYAKEGYEDNARFYRNLDAGSLEADITRTTHIPQPVKVVQPQGFVSRMMGYDPTIVAKPPLSAPEPKGDRIAALRTTIAMQQDAELIPSRSLDQETDGDVRAMAARAAVRLAQEERLNDPAALVKAFDDYHTRGYAIRGLKELPPEKLLPIVESILKGSKPGSITRWDLAQLVRYNLGKRGLEILAELADDRYSQSAAEALGNFSYTVEKDPALWESLYRPTLEKMLAPNASIQQRRAAVWAVPNALNKGPALSSRGRPYYEELLGDAEADVRQNAISRFSYDDDPKQLAAVLAAGMKEFNQEGDDPERKVLSGTFIAAQVLLRTDERRFKEMGQPLLRFLEQNYKRTDEYGRTFLAQARRVLEESAER